MTKDEVRKKVAEVLQLMREERELKDQLMALEFMGEPEDVEKAYKKQGELLQAIDRLRWERLLPIVQEVGEFVAAHQGGTGEGAELASAVTAAVRGTAPSKGGREGSASSSKVAAPAPRAKPMSSDAFVASSNVKVPTTSPRAEAARRGQVSELERPKTAAAPSSSPARPPITVGAPTPAQLASAASQLASTWPSPAAGAPRAARAMGAKAPSPSPKVEPRAKASTR